jgi:hypothetical protein
MKISLYQKLKRIINHLYYSITLDEIKIKSLILQNKIDFLEKEVRILVEECNQYKEKLNQLQKDK